MIFIVFEKKKNVNKTLNAGKQRNIETLKHW